MNRFRTLRHTRQKISNSSRQLIYLVSQLREAGSRLEADFWKNRLEFSVRRLLASGDEKILLDALEVLYKEAAPAYDVFADYIEACVETPQLRSKSIDALLIAVPVLAWSRFPIPSGIISSDSLSVLNTSLQTHILATGAKLALCSILFSPDQLPTDYLETIRLADRLANAALRERNLKLDVRQFPKTITLLSDVRYLLGVVVVPHGSALFRWQEADNGRAEFLQQWIQQGGSELRSLLPACELEFQPIGAFHATVSHANCAARSWSLRSVVKYLQIVLNTQPANLRATFAMFSDDHGEEEYRIGFTVEASRDVVYGAVWPLLEGECDNDELSVQQIEAVLRETGVSHITMLKEHFLFDYCDDCGAPLYPSPSGEVMHAELSETKVETASQHLH